MTTLTQPVYLFEELSSKAQAFAIDCYWEDQAIEEEILSMPPGTFYSELTPEAIFPRMGWSYDCYGNRLRV